MAKSQWYSNTCDEVHGNSTINSDEYDRILGNPQCDKNSINPMRFPEPANFQHLTGFYANLLIPIISSSSVISYP